VDDQRGLLRACGQRVELDSDDAARSDGADASVAGDGEVGCVTENVADVAAYVVPPFTVTVLVVLV